jgi:hypothetical protein
MEIRRERESGGEGKIERVRKRQRLREDSEEVTKKERE